MPDRGAPAESLTAEAAFRREIAPWALLGLTLGLVEGATAAVLIKKTFAHAADPWLVNLAFGRGLHVVALARHEGVDD